MPNDKVNLEKILGSPRRVRILREMARNPIPLSVYKIRVLTGLRTEDVKKHLRILIDAGIVRELRIDDQRTYLLDREQPVVKALINIFELSDSQ